MFLMLVIIYPRSQSCFPMDVGPAHLIPNCIMYVLHDTIIQLGQVAMELDAAESHTLGYSPVRQDILEMDLLAIHGSAVQMRQDIWTDVGIGQHKNGMELQ